MNKLIIVLAVLLGYNCIVGLTAMPFKTGEMSDAERLIKSLDPSGMFNCYWLVKLNKLIFVESLRFGLLHNVSSDEGS